MRLVRRLLGDRDARLVLALVVLAAALRFGTLDAKGYWQDEAQTALLLRHGFLDMLGRLPDLRGAPPLYYLVARGWSALFGTGEVGLRSFSALLGVAAVPVAYLSGRELISGRAGLLAATLVATNPLLVWYGQEARAYAMLVVLAGLAFLFFARALGDGNRRDLWLWAISSVLATATNYFALFPFLAEAAWLLRAGRLPVPKRAVRTPLAVAGVLIVSLALLEGTLASRGAWIQGVSLFSRIVEIPGILLVGFETPAPYVVAGLAGVLAAVGLWLVVARGSARERRGAS
ncbi:MAG: glycosyltransferase family 39 protein, partial [Thermoleophilaceae bacterium]